MIPEWMLLMDMTKEERDAYLERKAAIERIERRQQRSGPKDYLRKR